MRSNVVLLGEGLKITSLKKPIVYFGKKSVEVTGLKDKILSIKLTTPKSVTDKKIILDREEYNFLLNCLRKFNIH